MTEIKPWAPVRLLCAIPLHTTFPCALVSPLCYEIIFWRRDGGTEEFRAWTTLKQILSWKAEKNVRELYTLILFLLSFGFVYLILIASFGNLSLRILQETATCLPTEWPCAEFPFWPSPLDFLIWLLIGEEESIKSVHTKSRKQSRAEQMDYVYTCVVVWFPGDN